MIMKNIDNRNISTDGPGILSYKYFKIIIINISNNIRKRDVYFRRQMETLKINKN